MSGSKGQQVNMGEEIEKALIYSLTRDARADNVRLLDAALRAAKVEGVRAAIEGATSLKASVANGIPPHERVGFVRACNELIGYAKARSAQIEEGE